VGEQRGLFNEIPEILIQLQEMENDGLVRLAKKQY
jgi:hypothetical protein